MPEGSERFIATTAPVDLVRTLGAFRIGGSDPSLRVVPREAWRASRNADGPATLQVCQLDDTARRFVTRAWGPGADLALDGAPALLGDGDDPEGFSPACAMLDRLHRRHLGLRFGRSGGLVEALLPIVVEQKVTTIEAHRSWHAFERAHGEPAPGPAGRAGLRMRPAPAKVATLAYSELHRFGIERRRADAMRLVARRASSIEALLAGRTADHASEVCRALESLPGIGPWTSTSAVQQALGAADTVIVGDYHLPHIVAYALAGEPRATDERMLELLEPFRGHRARAVRLLALSGHRAPRRAPKRRLRSIASI